MAKEYIADERRERIAQLVNDKGSIRISDLAKHFNVSKETVRKDLIYLDQERLICKKHGGAISVRENGERPLQMRVSENFEKKARIAQKALEYVEKNETVLLDSGSTILALTHLFSDEMKNTFVTNSLSAAVELAEKEIDFCLIGGEFSCITMSTNGLLATQALHMIKVDTAFLGTSGFRYCKGPSAKTLYDAQVKQDIMNNSQRKIVLADSSKFLASAFVQYAPWTDIDLLITDDDAPEDMLKEMRKKVEVVLA